MSSFPARSASLALVLLFAVACAEGALSNNDAGGDADVVLPDVASDLNGTDTTMDAARDIPTDPIADSPEDVDAPDAEQDAPADSDANIEADVTADTPLDIADTAPDTPDTTPDAPLECGELARCGNECVDLLSDPTSCGFCGRTCIIDNADAACVEGDCAIAACEPGHFDVDGALGNGCEVFDLCEPEEPCLTDCGGESVTTCDDGVASCVVPAETCNLLDDDCNGSCDDGTLAGCRTGIHRANGNGHIFTDQMEVVSAAPYRLESANYFYLYSDEGASLRPLFLCRKPNGKHLLSTQTNCEIGVGPLRTVGYISAENQCGSVPLYRLYHTPTDNHFYTLSEAERNNARDALGYVEQGIAGYVWHSP